MSDNSSICWACWERRWVVTAKWLARWAKSAAVKTWTGLVLKSSPGFSSFSRIAALESLSLLRMSQRTAASWWIWLGTDAAPALAMMESVSVHPWSRNWFLAFFMLVSIVRRLRVMLPWVLLTVHFRDIEVSTPVIGELGRLFPRVYPPVTICTDVTNNPIEEELRLTVVFHTVAIHFRHHEATGFWLIRRTDLCENVSMENSMLLFNFSLEWVGFFTYRLYGKSDGQEHQVGERTGPLPYTRSGMNCRRNLSLEGIVEPSCP